MKNLTELVFILDRSGSMGGMESDTIGGFNSMIAKQQKEEGDALVSTILFANDSEVIHDRIAISEVPKMTEKEYSVGGCTALLDAMGGAIRHISKIHKYIRKEDIPQHTMFVITTDGMENASRKYTADKVRKMVEEKKEEGWEFLFLGANIDAIGAASQIGIDEDRAVRFHNDSMGSAVNYEAVCGAVSAVRNNKGLSRSWKKKIEDDYRSREA